MCTNLVKIHMNQETTLAPCKRCDECKALRKRMTLGLVLAEEHAAKETWFSTYTYDGGEDNPEAFVLDYRDLQRMFYRMRKAGLKFAYVAVGEYGEKKGRAHWHVLFFWKGPAPERNMDIQLNHPNKDNGEEPFWSHGIVQHEYPRSNTATSVYVMKYLSKGEQQYNNLRKSAGMGLDYLREYARKHAKSGLPIFNQQYASFTLENGNNTREGKPFYYPVDKQNSAYKAMLDAWFDEWVISRTHKRLAMNDHIMEYLTEIVHCIDDLPKHQQDYLAEHYGFEPTADAGRFVKAIVQHPTQTDLCVEIQNGFIDAIRVNNRGETQWRKNLTLSPNDVEAQRIHGFESLLPAVLKALDQAIKPDLPQITRQRAADAQELRALGQTSLLNRPQNDQKKFSGYRRKPPQSKDYAKPGAKPPDWQTRMLT